MNCERRERERHVEGEAIGVREKLLGEGKDQSKYPNFHHVLVPTSPHVHPLWSSNSFLYINPTNNSILVSNVAAPH